MKKNTNRLIIIMPMLTFMGIKVYPMVDTVRIDGIRYELRDDGENCICTVLNSEDTIIYKNYGNKMIDYEKYSYYEGDIVIPEKVLYNGQEYSVTGVSNYAFAFCSGLRSLSLPTSLSDIGTGAFEYCVSLEDIVIPNSVSHIGDGALYGCFKLKSVQLSTSLDTIPSGLFSDCYQLKEVEIPEGVVYVGHSVFANCYMLENISFPSTLEKIGNLAKKYFQFDCYSLANVYIRAESAPEQDYHQRVSYVGEGDENPEMLNKYKMPCVLHVPVGSAEDYASAEGWGYFHSTVEYDPETGPDYSYKLDDVRYWNEAYSSYKVPKNTFVIDGISYLVLSEEERTCGVVASRIYYHDDYYVIPEKVTHEGVEYTVVSLSYYSFSGCTSVKGISLPETVKEVSSNSLSDCYSIESLRLPSGIKKINLEHLVSLNELIVESSSIKFTNSVHPLMYNIDDIYLLNADNPKQVSLPSTLGSFRRIKPRLHVPEHALSVYESDPSFSKYWTLVGIPSDDPMPDTVSSNGYTADLVSNNIYYTVQPEGVMVAAHVVNREKFRENFGFDGPLTPRDPIAGGQQPRTPMRVHSMNALGTGTDTGLEDYTPYNGNLIIPESVSANGSTYSVLGTDYYAFIGCTELDTVSFPESVTTLGYGSFAGCIGLKGVNIPSGVGSIPDAMFYGCTSLDGVVLPEGIATIGHSAFYNCSGLTEIVIPASVELIDEYAFFGCTGLKRIVIEGNPEIAPTAFMGVPTEVVVLLWKESGILGGNPVHYSPDGRIIPADRPGLHIIKAPDGSVSKVLVR